MAFFISTLLILHMKGETVGHLFTMLSSAFGNHQISVSEVRLDSSNQITDIADVIEIGEKIQISADTNTPIYVLLLQIFGAYFAYIFGKYI